MRHVETQGRHFHFSNFFNYSFLFCIYSFLFLCFSFYFSLCLFFRFSYFLSFLVFFLLWRTSFSYWLSYHYEDRTYVQASDWTVLTVLKQTVLSRATLYVMGRDYSSLLNKTERRCKLITFGVKIINANKVWNKFHPRNTTRQAMRLHVWSVKLFSLNGGSRQQLGTWMIQISCWHYVTEMLSSVLVTPFDARILFCVCIYLLTQTPVNAPVSVIHIGLWITLNPTWQ